MTVHWLEWPVKNEITAFNKYHIHELVEVIDVTTGSTLMYIPIKINKVVGEHAIYVVVYGLPLGIEDISLSNVLP
jgi:hypothetical protein